MSLRTFIAEALTNFDTVAAVTPSSKYLAAAMLETLALRRARVVVEFGAGTGAITRELLRQLPSDAHLLVFEINPRFFAYLRQSISDPRVELISSSAEDFDTELHRRGIQQVDCVASSLGLALMPEPKRHALFERLAPFLHPRSAFTQYHYIHGLQWSNGRLKRMDLRPLLQRYFASVESRIVWRNLPPAWVFSCYPQPIMRASNSWSHAILGQLRSAEPEHKRI